MKALIKLFQFGKTALVCPLLHKVLYEPNYFCFSTVFIKKRIAIVFLFSHPHTKEGKKRAHGEYTSIQAIFQPRRIEALTGTAS